MNGSIVHTYKELGVASVHFYTAVQTHVPQIWLGNSLPVYSIVSINSKSVYTCKELGVVSVVLLLYTYKHSWPAEQSILLFSIS